MFIAESASCGLVESYIVNNNSPHVMLLLVGECRVFNETRLQLSHE